MFRVTAVGKALWHTLRMMLNDPENKVSGSGSSPDIAVNDTPQPEQGTTEDKPKEIGGRDGPDPTRYGDWEKAGRCIDF